ncbi:glutathione S-transferase family protein [Rhizobium sp. KVB221]|uniref:Glutathione S-transferase family protein n=1 Tax=Rhizobium setariae TaxID=2801340 RepID=A0A937CKD4_9HYPH|nr:glutathione S-transferase family protein [Rhizobium setariae]MBL0372020.1 glutathione S-transferase family protein [Rhizobium setariae]
MGLLVDGVWHDVWYDTKTSDGQFVRAASQFRNFITPDGSAGPTGKAGFKAESGRYHLYVSYACPWAHRTLIFRILKGLADHISVSVVHPLMLEKGWVFHEENGATPDHLFGSATLADIYLRADPTYSGRVTVPVLWDKHTGTIVSNESAEIIRMFNSAFDGLTGNELDFYPEDLRNEIDELNSYIYDSVNNGVYKCGFATSQAAYERSFDSLFAALDKLERRLEGHRYLVGDRLTEADWRLFTTLIRFDAVYVGHFKCNRQRIVDYRNLQRYLNELYLMPGIRKTVNFDHIKRHYYGSHKTINPNGIVPLGPQLNIG